MSELTLQDVYTGLSARMDTMTQELVRIGTVVDKLETLDHVTVKNGGDREYTQTRQQFVQWAYDNGKPGGLIDGKIETAKALLENKIAMLDPANLEDQKDRKMDRMWKMAGRIAMMILGLVFLIKFVDWNTIFDLIR